MLRAISTLILFAATAAFGQSADAPIPTFDVASVKVSQPGADGGLRGRGNTQVSPGTVTMRNVSLKTAIRWAWHVTEEELRRMMQALLRERFKLELHRQTRELGAYLLVAGKNGPKFHESTTEGEGSVDINQRQLSVTVQRTPVSRLVEMMSNMLRAPVIDMTGLKGRYDLTLNVAQYAADLAAQGKSLDSVRADPEAFLSMILQEEFGLKLEARKMALEVVVIDRAEKSPVEN